MGYICINNFAQELSVHKRIYSTRKLSIANYFPYPSTVYEHHNTPYKIIVSGQVDTASVRLDAGLFSLLRCRFTLRGVDLFYLPVHERTRATYPTRYSIAAGNAPLKFK